MILRFCLIDIPVCLCHAFLYSRSQKIYHFPLVITAFVDGFTDATFPYPIETIFDTAGRVNSILVEAVSK